VALGGLVKEYDVAKVRQANWRGARWY
jgi:hypothetical protein